MSRGRKLKKQQIGAVTKLQQSCLVEKVKICKDWIVVWFETGIIEKWIFEELQRKIRLRPPILYIQLPADESEWIKKDIPILDEDPIGLDAVFQNKKGEVADNFLVKCEDIKKGGFFDKRMLAHKITMKVLLDGWLKPEFNIDRLKKDWDLLNKSYKPQPKMPRSAVSTQNLYHSPRKNICGYAVWSHFFDLESYKDKKHPFKKCYDDPDIIMSAINKLIENKIKITRTNLLFSVLKKSFIKKEYGPYEFKPNVYRDIFTRIFNLKNPVILDYTPDLGNKAIATVLCNGVYIYKDHPIMKWSDKFADFSGGKLIKDDESKAADIGIIGAIGAYKTPSMELISEVRKRSTYTLVFCRCGDEEKQVLSYAPTKQIIKIMAYKGKKVGKILVYKQD